MVDLNKGATVELVKALSDDIRTGADGTKRASAGAMVREIEEKADEFRRVSADLEKATGYVPIVFPDWHIGNVLISDGEEWAFNNADRRRVCLASADKAIPLPAGTVIGLTDYSAAKIFIGWRTGTSGNYTYKIFATRNWIQTNYTTVEDGEYMILIASAPTEHPQSDLHDLLDLLFIRKPDAVMSDEFRHVSADIEKVSHKIMNGSNLWRLKPHYDHLWIDYVNKQSVIPSESVFSVPISKQLGFDMIEANVNKLTDGNYLVMHPVNGKFGNQVKHVDGVTDISGIAVTSVTLDWVKENVRYNSVYDKYCTTPSSLQEFLTECRKNCLVPLIQYVDADMVAIADEIMGKDNYVLYGQQPAARAASDAIMLCWKNLTDIDDIKEWVKAYYPCGYSVANPGDFTDEELAEIVTEVHKLGGLVGFAGSYVTEAVAQKLWSLGFDYSASGYAVNPFQSGNICNLSADADYGDFSTDGSVSGHLLTLAAGNTVSNGTSYDTAFLSAAMLTIRFDGKISVSMGSYITDSNCVLESDGTQSVTLSTYLLEQAPSFRVTAVEQTDVISIAFKAMSASDAVGFTSSDKAKLDGITIGTTQEFIDYIGVKR